MEWEAIKPPSNQSFRLFSWDGDIEKVRLHRADGSSRTVKGLGNRWHFHRECELTIITGGTGTRFIGNDVAHLQTPNLVLLGSNLPHFWATRNCSGYCAQFNFGSDFDLVRLEELTAFVGLIGRAGSGLAFSDQTTQQVAEQFEQAIGQNPLRRLATLLEIFDCLIEDGGQAISSTVPALSSDDDSIREAVQFIVENAHETNLSLQKVLDHVGASKSSFSRTFRSRVGQTYTDFVLEVRLEKVRHLLLTTESQISEVAYESGFGNLSSFNQAFRRKYGVTPKTFRQRKSD